MRRQLAALHRYPVKSCAPRPQASALVERRGMQHDRRWMVVGADGHFITGRQYPRLTLLQAEIEGVRLQLRAEGLEPITVDPPRATDPRLLVTIWRNRVEAPLAADAANDWISAFMGRDCRLVHMDAAAVRPVDPQFARAGDEVSFADAYPLLLTSTASLQDLNMRLALPVGMLRFRPNIVIEGGVAYEEDGWKRLRIGDLEFDVAKPCSRCVFTTVDPATGAFDPSGEPFKTLSQYRQAPGGVMFGMNLIARGEGMLRLGDTLEVLD